MKQTTLESLAWKCQGKMTRRERFLSEMDTVIPWAALTELIEPHYPQRSTSNILARNSTCRSVLDVRCIELREICRRVSIPS
jgi:hypothetical protein